MLGVAVTDVKFAAALITNGLALGPPLAFAVAGRPVIFTAPVALPLLVSTIEKHAKLLRGCLAWGRQSDPR
jgi:hypothetical protein